MALRSRPGHWNPEANDALAALVTHLLDSSPHADTLRQTLSDLVAESRAERREALAQTALVAFETHCARQVETAVLLAQTIDCVLPRLLLPALTAPDRERLSFGGGAGF